MQIHLINLVKSSTLQYEYEQLLKKFTFSSSDKDDYYTNVLHLQFYIIYIQKVQ